MKGVILAAPPFCIKGTVSFPVVYSFFFPSLRNLLVKGTSPQSTYGADSLAPICSLEEVDGFFTRMTSFSSRELRFAHSPLKVNSQTGSRGLLFSSR